MPLDINRVRDNVNTLCDESIKLLNLNASQMKELADLRSELETTKKALNESRELNQSLRDKVKETEAKNKEAAQKLHSRVNELESRNKELTQQAEAANKRMNEMMDHPDVKRKRMEQLKARAAKDSAAADQLEKELSEPAKE